MSKKLSSEPELVTTQHSALDSVHDQFMRNAERNRFNDVEQINGDPRIERAKQAMVNQFKGQLYFDQQIVPPGWVYGWVAETLYGQLQHKLLAEAYEKGWRPVPAARHPDLVNPDVHALDKTYDPSFIRRGGQILMEREKELHEHERGMYDKVTQDRINEMNTFGQAMGTAIPGAQFTGGATSTNRKTSFQ